MDTRLTRFKWGIKRAEPGMIGYSPWNFGGPWGRARGLPWEFAGRSGEIWGTGVAGD